MIPLLRPDWSAPERVHALGTTRAGGVSRAPFDSLNLGASGGDDPDSVAANRALLRECLPSEPGWIRQVHGHRVVRRENLGPSEKADALVCSTPGLACTLLTADCLPVLFCDLAGTEVAAAHAGWRGLAAGVLEATLERMVAEPAEVLAWIGPGISCEAYAVGPELRSALLDSYPDAGDAFPLRQGQLFADLAAIARLALGQAGVCRVTGGGFCTHADQRRFFSFRRDGRTGRMATSIWLS